MTSLDGTFVLQTDECDYTDLDRAAGIPVSRVDDADGVVTSGATSRTSTPRRKRDEAFAMDESVDTSRATKRTPTSATQPTLMGFFWREL